MKACGIPIKIASRCVAVVESIITKFLLVISICSIIYSPTWLPVFLNFAFLLFALFSLACYSLCWKKRNNIFVLPILIYETVTIFWIMIWLYASVTAITTGYLWSLEWIGGPQTDRAPTSHDILDEHYVNPNETNPETTKAIKYGSVILIISFVVLILKVFAWSITRRVFKELRKEREMFIEETTASQHEPPKKVPPGTMIELRPMLDEKARPTRTPSPRESYI